MSGEGQGNSSPSLLGNLRNFRFQKKNVKKLIMSDDDSNLTSPELLPRRKCVNRIVDSDEETSEGPPKIVGGESDAEDVERERKMKYLSGEYPDIESSKIREVLTDSNWNTEEAQSALKSLKKRPLKKSKNSSKKKRRKREDDEEETNIDSDEATYTTKVFDSDEDSDAEISNDLTGDKKAVLGFMQTGRMAELLLMPHCSQKKAQAIIDARPFENWRDLVEKFQTSKYLDTELLNSAQSLLATRSVVEALMKKCLRLSANMEKAVSAGSHMIPTQPSSLSPELTLAPYQMVGLNWLAVMHSQNVNGILADEMGLGKTVQIIAFLTYLKETSPSPPDGPHLIVVPSSTMENWSNELSRWSPSLNVVQYYGSQDERKCMRMGWRNGDLDDVDILLTTYNLVSSTPEERRLFRVLPIEYVIFDEAHMLKNMSTIRYENLVRINAKHRVLLTGTPLQNNLLELISLLIFVMPSIFAGKQNDLKSLFAKNPKLQSERDSEELPLFEQEQVKNAKQIMRPFVLRRLKSEVLRDLPTKTEAIVRCPMIKKQKELYQKFIREFSEEAGSSAEVNGVGMMMQLRKLANHPVLIRDYYDEDKVEVISKRLAKDPTYKQTNPQFIFEDLVWMSDYQIAELTRVHRCLGGFALPQEIIPESGKLKMLDEHLPKLKAEGHRVLIFSQFTMVLDYLEEYLTMRGHVFLRLDGQTPVVERQDLIDEFTNDEGIFVFLLSTKAGGLGINLTAADTVIIHDIDFNPYNDKQAEDRCHRVGQTKPVNIIRLLSEGTIEEGMYEVAQQKLHLEQQITGNEENENTDKKSILKLLKQTLGLDPHNKSVSLSPSKTPTKSQNGFDGEF
ncbi:SWI/SNF-related matrix-associated actin-dependent regulator of chromatin subfamily A containing DEAD/H box 1 homolog [Diachasma alloeum]|uniref:SWI/SNF-related matrix-associated actin-dependent regulator of chromatin subfamily A containing DEAD/H box 1 homolog n=1 Tax=Diachasma alloeum TaxID=454923 RepID=UPI00073819B0|nr:SWI/SNF-related matrix-associated actin-dependent regulator of chromatin subfamily A containing DEAD/H box 1 homolog [Diachasma alloeum]